MPGLKTRVEYTSTDTSPPFRLTAVAGAETAAIGSRGWYYITDKVDKGYNVLVEGTVTSEGLWVDDFYNDNASGFYFQNGVDIQSAFDGARFNVNQGGMKGVLLLGQSNMVGKNGEQEEAGMLGYDPVLDTPDANILQLRRSARYTLDHATFETDDTNLMNKFVIATEPLDHALDANVSVSDVTITGTAIPSGVGCGLTFAKQMLRGKYKHTNARVCLLPSANGGTSLINGSFNWAVPSGSMYLYCVGMINEFLAAHPDNEIVAILYQQGEADVFSGTVDPGEWDTAHQLLMNAIRAGTGITFNSKQTSLARVPYLIGGIKVTGSNNNINIHDSMAKLALDNNHCEFAPEGVGWTYGGSFDIHADAPANRDRGLIFYQAYLRAMSSENRKYWAQRPLTMVNPAISEEETTLTVTWDATPDIAQRPEPVIDYQLRIRPTGGSYATAVVKAANVFTHTFTGLTDGQEYEVELRSRSAVGFSNETILTETPLTNVVPTQVQNFAVNDQPATIDITWDALVFDPVVTGYTLSIRESGVGTFGVEIADITIGPQSTVLYQFTAPSDDTDYDFRLTATNSIGEGAATAILTAQHNASAVLAANAVLWLRAGIGEVADSTYTDRMLTWTDQSAANTVLTRPTTATYEDDIPLLNEGDGATFGNKDGWYIPNALTQSTETGYTWVVECTIPVIESGNVFIGINGIGELRQNGTAGAISVGITTPISSTGVLVAGVRAIIAVTHVKATNTLTFYKYEGGNAVAKGTNSRTYPASDNRVAIGCRPYGPNNDFMASGYGLEGDIHNLAIFPTALDVTTLKAVMEGL